MLLVGLLKEEVSICMGQVGDAKCITYMYVYEFVIFQIMCNYCSINSTVLYLYNRSMTLCLILSLMKVTLQ